MHLDAGKGESHGGAVAQVPNELVVFGCTGWLVATL